MQAPTRMAVNLMAQRPKLTSLTFRSVCNVHLILLFPLLTLDQTVTV